MRIATKLLISAAALVAATAPALAGDTWAGAYGGTIVSTYANGSVVKVYVNADHSYSITLPNGSTLKGTWAGWRGRKLLVHHDRPAAAGRDQAGLLPDQGL